MCTLNAQPEMKAADCVPAVGVFGLFRFQGV